jgi:hypothetical protein
MLHDGDAERLSGGLNDDQPVVNNRHVPGSRDGGHHASGLLQASRRLDAFFLW